MLPGTTFSDPSAQSANQGNPSLAPYTVEQLRLRRRMVHRRRRATVGVALFRRSITGFTVQGNNTIPFNQLGVAFDSLTTLQQQAITNRGGPDVATVTVTSRSTPAAS
jgi:hypothetical protein